MLVYFISKRRVYGLYCRYKEMKLAASDQCVVRTEYEREKKTYGLSYGQESLSGNSSIVRIRKLVNGL